MRGHIVRTVLVFDPMNRPARPLNVSQLWGVQRSRKSPIWMNGLQSIDI
jgi:hypothetical protein